MNTDCKFNEHCNIECKDTGHCKLFVIRTGRRGSSCEKIEQ